MTAFNDVELALIAMVLNQNTTDYDDSDLQQRMYDTATKARTMMSTNTEDH